MFSTFSILQKPFEVWTQELAKTLQKKCPFYFLIPLYVKYEIISNESLPSKFGGSVIKKISILLFSLFSVIFFSVHK